MSDEPAEAAFRARETFFVAGKDGQRTIRGGSWVAADDPIVKTHRQLLEPLSEVMAAAAAAPPEVIEQATAAPGERRHVKPKAREPHKPSSDD